MKKLILILMVSLLAACASSGYQEKTVDIRGVWHIEAIGRLAVIKDSPADITFLPDGSFAGNASCNRFFGSYEHTGDTLRLDERIGSTMMMCAEPLMDQEQRLLKLLPTTHSVSVEHGTLVLSDKDGNQVIQAAHVK
jgi:heat shock protein HslJ